MFEWTLRWARAGGRAIRRSASRLSYPLLLAASLFGRNKLYAQEALRSALSVDQVLQTSQAAVVLPPDQPHLGPVQLSLGLYAGVELNDNVNTAESNPQSDILLRGGINTGFYWPVNEQSEMRVNAGLGYVHYLNHPNYDYFQLSPNSALDWKIGLENGNIDFFDQFSYSQEVVTESALAGDARFPRFDNTVGTRIDWSPNRWVLQAGYSHNNFLSDSSQFDYLNRSSEYLFTRGGRQLADKSEAGLEASASFTDYYASTQNDTTSISVGAYADWQLTQAIHASLRGGPTLYEFQSTGSGHTPPALTSYYVTLELRHNLTDFLSHSATVQREVRLGVEQGGQTIEQFTAGYSVSYAMTPHVTLDGNFSYIQGSQSFQQQVNVGPIVVLIPENENFEQYAVGPDVTWRLTEKFSARLNYNYYLRNSNLAGRNYTQNSLALIFSYTF